MVLAVEPVTTLCDIFFKRILSKMSAGREEKMFRGILQTYLLRRGKDFVALAIKSLF